MELNHLYAYELVKLNTLQNSCDKTECMIMCMIYQANLLITTMDKFIVCLIILPGV